MDEALCFGWIDGIRKSCDQRSYMIRFTPRKANSIWTNVNVAKLEAPIARGTHDACGARHLREAESGA